MSLNVGRQLAAADNPLPFLNSSYDVVCGTSLPRLDRVEKILECPSGILYKLTAVLRFVSMMWTQRKVRQ